MNMNFQCSLSDIVSAEELAMRLGYSGATEAFRGWCRMMNISHLPGRSGSFDMVLVRVRFNQSQGLNVGPLAAPQTDRGEELLNKRNKRHAAN